MNPTTASSANMALSSYSGEVSVNVQKIENGYLVSFWSSKNYIFHCSDLAAVQEKLAEVFGK